MLYRVWVQGFKKKERVLQCFSAALFFTLHPSLLTLHSSLGRSPLTAKPALGFFFDAVLKQLLQLQSCQEHLRALARGVRLGLRHEDDVCTLDVLLRVEGLGSGSTLSIRPVPLIACKIPNLYEYLRT